VGAFVWVTAGLAIWHFTVFLPDKFKGGIVGAFLGSIAGSLAFGFLINGLAIPGRSDTDLLTAFEAIPGSLIGMGLVYLWGARGPQPEELAYSTPVGTGKAR
jgi:hypothetical protein